MTIIMILIVLGIVLYICFTVWAISKGLANKFPMDEFESARMMKEKKIIAEKEYEDLPF